MYVSCGTAEPWRLGGHDLYENIGLVNFVKKGPLVHVPSDSADLLAFTRSYSP